MTLTPQAELVFHLLAATGVTLYVFAPLVVLTHELGHALAVIRTGKRPVVQVGIEPAWFSWQSRRLEVHFNPRLRLEGDPAEFLGWCRYEANGLTVAQLRRIHAAGPRASLIGGLVLAGIAYLITDAQSFIYWSVLGGAFLSFADAMLNLLPTYRGRFVSDGARMAKLRGLSSTTVLYPAMEDPPTASGSA